MFARSFVVISLPLLFCFQASAKAASCPKGSIRVSSKAVQPIIYTWRGNWEGEKPQVCEEKMDRHGTFICPTFKARNRGREVLSKEGRWVPFSNDRLPAHKAEGWNNVYENLVWYDAQIKSIVTAHIQKIRTGNPHFTDKYIQLRASYYRFSPCKKVSF